ncbi:MAG: hypothetical protein JWO46_284 [Nocardioidaceae bacterium]|nr:hypothetical protein [Nocardioidaceae bacterium]
MFEELQMVLRCCERLVEELAPAEGEPDAVRVEGLWTTALLSYGRCFTAGTAGVGLTEADLTEAQPNGDVVEWHRILLQLRDHQADPVDNPRERFSVGVTQDDETRAATGVAITSTRQPLVDDLTVRQTGAIAYALSALVNARIETLQETVFEELKSLTKDDLDKLDRLDVAPTVEDPASGS